MRPLIVATALLLASCGPSVRSGTAPVTQAPDGVATAAASPSASASASPMATAFAGTRPLSAGAVPDAGVLYVQGTDDQIYRYDGLSGRLDPVSGKSAFAHETPFGAQILGRHERLRARGQRVEYVVFPDEGHGFTTRRNAEAAYAKIVDFLTTELLG